MASEGPNSPSTVETIDRDSKQVWTDYGNASGQSDAYTNIDIASQDYTDWLRCTNYGMK